MSRIACPPVSVGKFFALVLGLSIPFYILGALGPDLTKLLPIQLPISALVFVCPALAALWLTREAPGQVGVRALLGRMFDLQRLHDKRWLLPTFLSMPAVMSFAYIVQKLLGQTLPAFKLSPVIIFVYFAVFFIGAIGEELGWIGYSMQPLQQRYGALIAGLLLGTFWALWHIIPWVQTHHSAEWVLWQCAGTVALRVLMVWIYNGAEHNLFTSIAFHTMTNVSEFAFPNSGSYYDSRVTGLILIGAALFVVWRWRARLREPATADLSMETRP